MCVCVCVCKYRDRSCLKMFSSWEYTPNLLWLERLVYLDFSL